MSNSDSDDDFLSADEGDDNSETTSTIPETNIKENSGKVVSKSLKEPDCAANNVIDEVEMVQPSYSETKDSKSVLLESNNEKICISTTEITSVNVESDEGKSEEAGIKNNIDRDLDTCASYTGENRSSEQNKEVNETTETDESKGTNASDNYESEATEPDAIGCKLSESSKEKVEIVSDASDETSNVCLGDQDLRDKSELNEIKMKTAPHSMTVGSNTLNASTDVDISMSVNSKPVEEAPTTESNLIEGTPTKDAEVVEGTPAEDSKVIVRATTSTDNMNVDITDDTEADTEVMEKKCDVTPASKQDSDSDPSRQDGNILMQENNPVNQDKEPLTNEPQTSTQDISSSTGNANPPKQDDWGWDSWADDFISQATNTVSSLLVKVEDHLGIPDPSEMAQLAQQTDNASKVENDETREKDVTTDKQTNETTDITATTAAASDQSTGMSSWFSSFVPIESISNLVQNTGQEFVAGSIDALEFIGKKTVDILSEGDPGLRSKRGALAGDKPGTLSAILKEAKTRTEQKERSDSAAKGENPAKFNDMFEKFQGVAHLDALAMLSSEYENKLGRILNVQSDEAKDESMELLAEVKGKFEFEEIEEKDDEKVDFKKQVYLNTKKLQMKVTCSKLLNTWSKLKDRTKDMSNINDTNDCFESAISSLAELTSRFIEFYRKVADMLIMTDMQAKQSANQRASSLKSLTELFQMETLAIADSYANHLVGNNEEKNSDFITDIYLEGSNCSSLLQESHQLLLPILQCSVIK